MEQIIYIKGKDIKTKSIDDSIVTCHFEISVKTYEKLHKHYDDVLTLLFTWEWIEDIEIKATFNKDWSNSLSYQWDHAMIKLDIILPSLLFVGYILTSNIHIKLW